ncbi:MAG: aminoacyl-tRNA hydrolase [Chloroflexi bacterium]|nr:aminoacyl-tRNA hydrolase [Chloroflexota bacterium]
MKAIVGLGNPGPQYRNSRHNVGWLVVDRLAARWCGGWQRGKPEKARHSEVVRCTVEGETVLLVKPLTYMNDSGKAVRALVEKERLTTDDILVVYDDLDLELGRIRVRAQGSSGGHRGIKSIQEHLTQLARLRGPKDRAPDAASSVSRDASEANPKSKVQSPRSQPPAFPRIKVGIGRPPVGVDAIDHVLTSFRPDELPIVEPALECAADAAECWQREGIDVTMNRYNAAETATTAGRSEQGAGALATVAGRGT